MKSSLGVLWVLLFVAGCGGSSGSDTPVAETPVTENTAAQPVGASVGSATFTKNDSGVSFDGIRKVEAFLQSGSGGSGLAFVISQDSKTSLCPGVLATQTMGNSIYFALDLYDLQEGYIPLTDENVITTFGNNPDLESSEGLVPLTTMRLIEDIAGDPIQVTGGTDPNGKTAAGLLSSQNEVTLTSANLSSGGTITGSFSINPIRFSDLAPMGVISGQFTAIFKDCTP